MFDKFELTEEKRIKLIIGALVVLLGIWLVLWFVKGAFATNDNKVFWCHCAESGQCNTLHLPQTALVNAGHVSANGNPLHAGDHAGACAEPTVTPVPTVTTAPSATPTFTPSPTSIPEVTVTPRVTPEVTPTVTETPQRNDVVRLSTNTTSTPTCDILKPESINDVWLQPDASNNGTLVLRWGVNDKYSRVNVVYGLTPGDMRYSLLNTENDGVEEIKGLANGTHYWFSVANLDGCAVGDYEVWRDPLP